MESDVLRIILDVLAVLAILIPVAYGIARVVIKAFKDKNYAKLISSALELIVVAEGKYSNGADKKKFVLSMLEEVAKKAGIKYDTESLSATIDDIIAVTKRVNK